MVVVTFLMVVVGEGHAHNILRNILCFVLGTFPGSSKHTYISLSLIFQWNWTTELGFKFTTFGFDQKLSNGQRDYRQSLAWSDMHIDWFPPDFCDTSIRFHWIFL